MTFPSFYCVVEGTSSLRTTYAVLLSSYVLFCIIVKFFHALVFLTFFERLLRERMNFVMICSVLRYSFIFCSVHEGSFLLSANAEVGFSPTRLVSFRILTGVQPPWDVMEVSAFSRRSIEVACHQCRMDYKRNLAEA